MDIKVSTYVPGSSPVHALDARVKIVLLVAYTVTLFMVRTWWALGACVALFLVAALSSRVPLRRFFSLLGPVCVIACFSILFNAFSLDAQGASPAGVGAVSAGVLAQAAPVALVGGLSFVPAGFARGCFYAVRILVLVVASLVLTFTTTSTSLTSAFSCFLRPLRRLRVPVDDVATVLSLALRFIPVTAEEFGRVHAAQRSRGARFDDGTLWQRLRAWAVVFIPLFVGLFRRADALAVAMDARCYGAPGTGRSTLNAQAMTAGSWAVLAAGLALCLALSVAG